MNRLFVLTGVLALGLGVSSCSKKQDAAANSTASTAAQTDASGTASPASPAAPSPVASAPQTLEDEDANAQLKDLRLQVDAYEKIYKRKPASLDQMVQEGFMSKLPPAPPGKRFDYDPTTARVNLVSQ